MLELKDDASLAAALADPDLDDDLRALLAGLTPHPPELHGLRVYVIQGGDTPEVINRALGWAFTGYGAEEQVYNWIEEHEGFFEIGLDAGIRLLIENGPGTELGIHLMCLSHFWPEDEAGS